MTRTRIVAISAAMAGVLGLAACAPSLGPPPPGGSRTGPAGAFRAADFAWSTEGGRGAIAGHLTYRAGKTRYTCARTTIILTPETAWTRRRMEILYRSAEASALPADEVRARTPTAPSGRVTPVTL
jgi:hypothetical protein